MINSMARKFGDRKSKINDCNAVKDPFPHLVVAHPKYQRQAQFGGMEEKMNGIREMGQELLDFV
jgi:hypothetical protein